MPAAMPTAMETPTAMSTTSTVTVTMPGRGVPIQLTAVVAVGIALGSVLAARYVPLTGAVRVLPVGIAMGLAVIAMVFIDDWRLAVAMLILIGAMGGYFVWANRPAGSLIRQI